MSDNVVKKAQQEQAQDLPAHNALTTLLLVLSASTMLQEQQLLRETGCMKRETRSEHLSCTQQKDRKTSAELQQHSKSKHKICQRTAHSPHCCSARTTLIKIDGLHEKRDEDRVSKACMTSEQAQQKDRKHQQSFDQLTQEQLSPCSTQPSPAPPTITTHHLQQC